MDKLIQVVILDDEESILRSLTRVFMNESYGIFTTTDHQEALQIIENNEIKVVLSDQRMPLVSGVEFLSTVKLKKPDTIRILFTGYADIQSSQDAINKGAVYKYISKPWNDEELKNIIEDSIHRFDLAAENARLQEMTQKQNAELKEANERIQKLYEKEKEFSSTVSHELKTPLTSMKMSIDIVMRKIDGKVDPDVMVFMNINKKNVERLSRLVNEILSLTKLESGTEPVLMELTDVNHIIKEVVLVQKILADDKGIVLKTALDSNLPEISLNPDKINQVLNNLVNNAIKFTGKGSVMVSSRVSSENNHVEIRVTDIGIGISNEDIGKLFQRFTQLGHTKDRVSGTGLGLAVCKEIVLKHNGKIWIESEQGKGSTFAFSLPKVQEVSEEKNNV